MTTTTTTTKSQATKIKATDLATLIRHSDAIDSVATAGTTIVDDAKWQALTNLVGAYVTLGKDVAKLCTSAKVTSADALTKAFRNEDSPVYVATDQRSELPTATKMSNALALNERHTSERFTAYRTATDQAGNRNTARLQDYTVWLNIVVTGKTSATSVDMAATKVTGKGAARKVGPLVKVPKASTPVATTQVAPQLGFFSDLVKMSSDDLTAIVKEGGDMSMVPMARRREMARRLMASVVLDEMTNKNTDADLYGSLV